MPSMPKEGVYMIAKGLQDCDLRVGERIGVVAAIPHDVEPAHCPGDLPRPQQCSYKIAATNYLVKNFLSVGPCIRDQLVYCIRALP